ncbi:MAG: polysaccharide deacetylase family protein [Candidatus Aquirickettsiella sp.]
MKIALTIDDLPEYGPTVSIYTYHDLLDMILKTINDYKIPGVIGFINGKHITHTPQYKTTLKSWLIAGCIFGNHTYSHHDLREISADDYIKDITKNEEILFNLNNTHEPRYYRYPFLLEGETGEKFYKIRHYLQENNYRVVPVTVDYLDYKFNYPVCVCLKNNDKRALKKLQEEYVNTSVYRFQASRKIARDFFSRDIKYILLTHSGIATALFLPAVIEKYIALGCKFVSVEEALDDEVYDIDPIFISCKSPNYLLRLAKVKRKKVEWPIVDDALLSSIAGIQKK